MCKERGQKLEYNCPIYYSYELCPCVGGTLSRNLKPSPAAKVGATVTAGDPPAGAVNGGRGGSNPLDGITPSATAMCE